MTVGKSRRVKEFLDRSQIKVRHTSTLTMPVFVLVNLFEVEEGVDYFFHVIQRVERSSVVFFVAQWTGCLALQVVEDAFTTEPVCTGDRNRVGHWHEAIYFCPQSGKTCKYAPLCDIFMQRAAMT